MILTIVNLVPMGMTLLAVAVTLGVYQQHLREEPHDLTTLQFVRRLGLLNAGLISIVVTALVLLCLGPGGVSVVSAMLCGLVGTAALSTLSFVPEGRRG